MERKNIFVVLGMARSGTSVITRGLLALGVDLGQKLTPADKLWNAKGFWEDTEIVYKINRGIFHFLNYNEMQYMQNVDETKIDAVQRLKQSAIRLLNKRMGNTQNWGFKDPRTAKVLPFWQDIFSELQLNEHYIITLRNPLASAYSYQHLKGTDIEIGLLWWLIHLVSAIEHTIDKRRIIIDYELLLKNPMAELDKIKNFLPFKIDREKEVDHFIHTFIDKKMQHYDYTIDDLSNHTASKIAPVCVKLYQLLKHASSNNIDLNSNYFLDKWDEIKKEFNFHYPVYKYIDSLMVRNKMLQRNMRSIKRSFHWKITFPLRSIKDFIKNRLEPLKEKKRVAKFYAE